MYPKHIRFFRVFILRLFIKHVDRRTHTRYGNVFVLCALCREGAVRSKEGSWPYRSINDYPSVYLEVLWTITEVHWCKYDPRIFLKEDPLFIPVEYNAYYMDVGCERTVADFETWWRWHFSEPLKLAPKPSQPTVKGVLGPPPPFKVTIVWARR